MTCLNQKRGSVEYVVYMQGIKVITWSDLSKTVLVFSLPVVGTSSTEGNDGLCTTSSNVSGYTL